MRRFIKPEDVSENQPQGIQHIAAEENTKRRQCPKHVFIDKTISKRHID